jgi:hypothetical protein
VAAAALALAALLAAPAEGFGIAGPGGTVRVGAALEAATVPPAPAPRLAFREEAGALVGEAEDARLQARVRVAPAGDAAGFDVQVEVRWKAELEVERIGLRLRLPGPARALGRDLAVAAVDGPRRVDLGTPLWVEGAGLALAGGQGLAAARMAPVGEGVEVQLLLDDAGAHPFAVYETCLPRLPPAAGRTWAALERKRSLARTRRVSGQVEAASVQLVPLAAGAPRPLVAERWPAGARAALVLTDHADRTDPAALRALLHGSSGPPAPVDAPGRGLLAHGLRITKSFFARDVRGGLLDDPEAAALAVELATAGSEVALHSPGTGADGREEVRAALVALRPFHLSTWIDHQPYTNCEALSSQGWEAGGRYGVRDILVEEGFRWAWEANDLSGFRGPRLDNLFLVARPGQPAPPVYPLPADPRLWVFQSTFFHAPPRELGAALSDAALDALEEQGGLFVGHTYLCASPRTTREPQERRRLVVRELPGGGLELDPDFEAGLARAGRRVRVGTLASLTLREAGDRLRALSGVRVVYLADGAARVENAGPVPVPGLTLAFAGEAVLEVDGGEGGGHALAPGRSRVFFDLGPGEAVVVRALDRGGPIPFLAAEPGARLAP